MKQILPWLLVGAIVGGILVWTLKPSPKPEIRFISSGELQITHDQWFTDEDSVEVKIEETGKIIENQPDTLKEYKFSIQHENFLIEGLAYARQLERIEVKHLRYTGTARVDVLSSGEPRISPITPHMTTSYLKDESIKARKKPWLNLVMIAGATTREPYRPLLLGGIGFERYLPKLMLGGGVVDQSPLIWIGKTWSL